MITISHKCHQDFCTPNQVKDHNFDIFHMALLPYPTAQNILSSKIKYFFAC